MSVAAACAHTATAISRAQRLFAAAPQSPTTVTEQATALEQAHERSATAGAHLVASTTGALADRYGVFTTRVNAALATFGRADTTIARQAAAAAAVTQSGAAQIEAIAAENRITLAAAAGARSPAAQRAVLAALRSQLTRIQSVVNDARAVSATLAGQVRAAHYPAATAPDDHIVGEDVPSGPQIQPVDNTTADPLPTEPASSGQPQIGPFPVPAHVAALAPPGPPRPVDPTGGLLTPQNLPPAEPNPSNIPGVRVPPPSAAAPAAPGLPSYPDLVNQVNSQGKTIDDMQNAQHNVTAGGVLGSGLPGCVSGGVVGALPTAIFPPADAVTVPGGCVVGAIGGVSSYLATIWGSNAFEG